MMFILLILAGGILSAMFTIGLIKIISAIDEIYDDFTADINDGYDDFF